MGKHSRCIQRFLDIIGVEGDAAVEIWTPLGFESDDLGAKVSEVHGTKGARPGPGQVRNADSFEWKRSIWCSALCLGARGTPLKLSAQNLRVVLSQRGRTARETLAACFGARCGGKMKKSPGTPMFYIDEEFPSQEVLRFGHLGGTHDGCSANTMLLHLVIYLEHGLFGQPFLDEPVYQIVVLRAARGGRKYLQG